MDLLMWELQITDREEVNPVIWRLADEVEPRHGIRVRTMRKRDMEAEVRRFMEIYNAAWERNWGFVPLTDSEVRHYAKQLKPIADERWAFIAEKDGEPVGAALTLPDFNQVLIHLGGRLLPLGWLKALYWRRKIDRVRVFALGVKSDYQHTGVAAKLYAEHFAAAPRTGMLYGEMGWILETNRSMNRAMEAMNGRIVRRFRLYERELGHP
jgi:GNAT superfamily N-acetyltransferase